MAKRESRGPLDLRALMGPLGLLGRRDLSGQPDLRALMGPLDLLDLLGLLGRRDLSGQPDLPALQVRTGQRVTRHLHSATQPR